MSTNIPEEFRDLLDNPLVVTIATVNPDGQPQLSLVWCSYDGEYVLVSTAVGRQKDKNLVARPKATVMAFDSTNPGRYLEVRGEVAERVLDKAETTAHLDYLAKLYTGADSYYGGVAPADQAGKETRVLYKIKPTKVVAQG